MFIKIFLFVLIKNREGSQSPTMRRRKRTRRRSAGDDCRNDIAENHEASNSSDITQSMGVPALGVTPIGEERTHGDASDIGRSALMQQLTKPADDMLQV